MVRPPRWLWKRLLARVRPSGEEPELYPILGVLLRTTYMMKTALNHLRFMDFSNITGYPGWICWKLGIVSLWHRFLIYQFPRPTPRRLTAPDPEGA